MILSDILCGTTIQGAYCIKSWSDSNNDYTILAKGTDFESDTWGFEEDILSADIGYIYAIDGILNIEVYEEV